MNREQLAESKEKSNEEFGMKEFIEQRILRAVRRLLAERVNEILGEAEFSLPLIEFGGYEAGSVVIPVISLSVCERTEKERIVLLDVYSMTISFALPESPDSELFCYAYAAAVGKALAEDPALGGMVSRAVVLGKKYVPPKKAYCGEGWGLVLSLRVTVQVAMSNEE
ncbi:hypothetical protein FACS1894161_1100 [Spirochaetia bacterium]|nr:hypothetical protein FACS1894161_1100 [Spirochaetia bacterium]